MSAWTEERHQEARDRCQKATPGPWIYGDGTSVVLCETGILDANREAILVNCGRGSGTETPEDGEFIAASRIDLPDALDEIERLKFLIAARDTVIYQASNDVAQLQAERDELCKDKERLDWIETTTTINVTWRAKSWAIICGRPQLECLRPEPHGKPYPTFATLREAIRRRTESAMSLHPAQASTPPTARGITWNQWIWQELLRQRDAAKKIKNNACKAEVSRILFKSDAERAIEESGEERGHHDPGFDFAEAGR